MSARSSDPTATTQRRLALGIEYDGSAFHGWQVQRDRRSLQACVEAAVARVAAEPVNLTAAGRTDAGVHAYEQVVHFDTHAQRPPRAWVLGVNTHLPRNIRILWSDEPPAGFHARYSAIARCYRYIILNREVDSALMRGRVTWCFKPLAIEPMRAAAACLRGEHDFSAFRAQDCQSRSPFRQVYFIDIRREGEQIIVEIAANAFLHHMVRNIVGVLLEIGWHKRPPEWCQEILDGRDRRLAAATAPPDGLHLLAVCYPLRYGLPRHPIFDRLQPDVKRHGVVHSID